jgi:hypothetical protein
MINACWLICNCPNLLMWTYTEVASFIL